MYNPPGFATSGGSTISTWPRILVQIAWNAGGNTTAFNNWYTVTDRLRGNWKATLSGRQYEMDQMEAGTFTFSLDNLDGAFDPDNTSSPFYPNVVPYRRCRLIFLTNPTQNLLYPWVADGTKTLSLGSTAGTLGVVTGLSAAPSGRTTAQTWAIPNGTASGNAFGLWGDVQPWTGHDCEGTTVAAGVSYSFAIDLQLAAGGMTGLDLKPRIGWYDVNGNLISRSIGNVATITTSWSRLSMTRTAPTGAQFAIVSISTNVATTAATTVNTTGWQLEQSAAPTAYAYPGAWVQMWQGFVERWPQKYDKSGKYGLIDLTAVDALAPLSQTTLGYVMPKYLSNTQSSNLQAAYAMTTTGASPDTSGSAFLPYAGTLSGSALDIIGSNIQTGVSITSTSPIGTLWNCPGPVITLPNNQASSLGNSANATYLRPSGMSLPSAGWTRLIVFRTSVTPGTGSRFGVATLWGATAPGYLSGTGDQSVANVEIYSDGGVTFKLQNSSKSAFVYQELPVNVCDGNWHCATLSLSADGKTARLTVDGQFSQFVSGTSLGSSTYTADAVGATITTNGSGENTSPFNGDIAFYAQWNTELSSNTTGDLTAGFATGWSGDNNATRTNRVISLAGFNTGANTNTRFVGSNTTVGGLTASGRSPIDIMQESAETEVGQFGADRNGALTLFGQFWRWIQTQPVVTFGENAGEIPYQADITFEQDPAHLYNDIQVTCDGAIDLTNMNALQEVQDSTSQGNYFPQTLQKTVNPRNVQGGLNVANYLLSQFKDPHTRLSGLSVDCASNPAALTALVNLEFANLVQVNRRPASAPMKSVACFIERVSWSGDDTGKKLLASFEMSPASQYKFGIISATWGQLTSGIAAGVSTITVGPLNGVNLMGAQNVIPANYQMTLGFGTANAETVTVQSVQTVSAGYTSVTLTLASPTVNSHNANDYLCDIEPGGIVLPPVGTYPTVFDTPSLTGGTQPLIGF